MKKIIAVLFVCMFVVPANADSFTYPYTGFYDGVEDMAGEKCSSGNKRILVCTCSPGQRPYPKYGNLEDIRCNISMNLDEGCKFNSDSGVESNRAAYCVEVQEPDACEACNCIIDTLADYNWKDIGGNRVSRMTEPYRGSYLQYKCTMESSREYGCAANYYQSGGNGENMTCSPCPNGGTNGIGTTASSTCKLPKDTEMTDDFGTYKCSSDYSYK